MNNIVLLFNHEKIVIYVSTPPSVRLLLFSFFLNVFIFINTYFVYQSSFCVCVKRQALHIYAHVFGGGITRKSMYADEG